MNQLQAAIIAHAEAESPREACGLVVKIDGVDTYHPCRNMAEHDQQFVMHPEDYAAADAAGEIVAVVHSHPNLPAEPSQADRVSCEASGLPWWIVSLPSKEWAYLAPEGYKAPLIGRLFYHGVLDCYSLIRDWYQEERGITLPDFERQHEWWFKGGDLYRDNFAKAGFVKVFDEPQVGDVMLMQILSNVPNHGAIYLGNNLILHHLSGRLSAREVYGGYYLKHTVAVLRYAGNSDSSSGG